MIDCCFKSSMGCTALRDSRCEGCGFKKTKEELAEGRRRALDRVLSLPDEQRIHIVRKYYAFGSGRHNDEG